jgi:hypothetical protein
MWGSGVGSDAHEMVRMGSWVGGNRRVESRTGASGVSLPVAHDAAFARVALVRLGLALFPVPAHRTEQARFAHSALVESVTRSPTESRSSAYSAERAQGFRARVTRRSCRRRGRTADARQARCLRTAGFGLKATGSALEDLAAVAGFGWNCGSVGVLLSKISVGLVSDIGRQALVYWQYGVP